LSGDLDQRLEARGAEVRLGGAGVFARGERLLAKAIPIVEQQAHLFAIERLDADSALACREAMVLGGREDEVVLADDDVRELGQVGLAKDGGAWSESLERDDGRVELAGIEARNAMAGVLSSIQRNAMRGKASRRCWAATGRR